MSSLLTKILRDSLLVAEKNNVHMDMDYPVMADVQPLGNGRGRIIPCIKEGMDFNPNQLVSLIWEIIDAGGLPSSYAEAYQEFMVAISGDRNVGVWRYGFDREADTSHYLRVRNGVIVDFWED